MPYCENCGTEISGEEEFCSNCGNSLKKSNSNNISSIKDKINSSEELSSIKNKVESSDKSFLKNSNNRKYCIGIVLILFLIFIASMFLFGGNSGDTVTVGDINFNIPEGYVYDSAFTNEIYDSASYSFLNNDGDVKAYTSNSGSQITIMVSNHENGDVDNWINAGYTPKTINGKEGVLDSISGYNEYMFSYMEDGKLVNIYVDDINLLEDIIK